MDNRISLAFQWSAEELNEAVRQHYSRGLRRLVLLTGYGLCAVTFCLLMVLLFLEGHPSSDFIFYLSLIVFFGLYFGFRSRTYQSSRIRRYRSHVFGKDETWDISDQFLVARLSDGTGGTLSWDSISQVLLCSKGFLLYDTPELFHWLPYHAFHSQDDIEAFVRLSKRKAKQYREATLSPLPNIVIGFLIAPAILPIVDALEVLWLAGVHYPGLGRLLFIRIIDAIPAVYTLWLLGGIPVLLLVRRLQSNGIGLFLIAGAVLGAIPAVVRWAQHLGIRTLGDFSFWSTPRTLLWVSLQLLSGVTAAALFWLIAVRLNPGWSRPQRAQ